MLSRLLCSARRRGLRGNQGYVAATPEAAALRTPAERFDPAIA
jgi:hypothetical protein